MLGGGLGRRVTFGVLEKQSDSGFEGSGCVEDKYVRLSNV